MGGDAREWDCGVCTFINASTAVRCEMCMAPAPEVVASEPQPQPQSGGLTYLQHVASDEDEGGPAKETTTSTGSTGVAVDATNNNPTSQENVVKTRLNLDFFMALPPELNASIFGLLGVKDIVNLSLVCHWLCDEIARNDYIWQQMFVKTYQKEERFVLMEGLDNGMARTGWRRAFKLQFYLQVTADLCDLISESKFYLLHTTLTQDPHHDLIRCDRSVGVEEGGQFSMLYRWRGERLGVSLSEDPPAPAAPAEQAARPPRPGDWMEDMGSVAEWDEEFQINLKSRLKKCASDSERDEVIGLGTTWVSKGDIVRRYCEQFTRCIVRRDYEEEAALRRDQRRAAAKKKTEKEQEAQPVAGSEAEPEVEGGGDDVWRDTLQMQLNDQHNWKERDSGCARRLMVKMLAKSPPITPPYIALPFDAWKVAKEYVDSLLDLFEVGERGCARYFCLAQEFDTRAGDRFLALGLLAVSPHRTLFFASIYDLTLAQLDALRMQKYMAEVDTEGYNYEDDEEQEETSLPDGPWACPVCTFVNYDATYKCDVCDSSRSAKRT